ncbi:unnamed protein product [Parnassius mnemosyne]|uniref:HTH CENPB-type domain-containing protein n=1 Tax=Parnassius mnemosyne TaxID=213953 RepID=A0AAV1KMX9_9NEOP
MPTKKIFFKYNQEDVYKAIEEIQVTAKIRETCRKYNIPHSTIINKLKMRHPLQRKMGPPTILTPQEEKLLCKWINASAKKGIPLKKEQLLDAVQNIIKSDNRPNPFKGKPPGRKWFSGFLKRNPDIAQRHAESINSARSRVTEEGLRRWHSKLKEFLISQDVQDILEDPDRILNCDESGFHITPDSGLVLGPRGMTNFFEIRDMEKESITVLGTFSASGKLKLVLVIYPYDRVPSEITRNFPENWCIGKSPKGWMTSRVFYGYIGNSLIPALHEANIKFPVLLLVDGHRSHISYEVSQLCNDNKIILYALHPNATHMIQPADVSVFRPLKHAWKSNVQKWKLSTGNRVVTRAQFAPLLKSSLNAATNEVISNGFRKCGLFPFDADAIDYTKCMSDPSRHDVVDKPAELGIEHLLYFESLMSRKRVAEFRAMKEGQPWVGEESAKELYDVWCKVYKTVTLSETLQGMEKTSNSTVHHLNNAELRNSETDPRSPLSETGPIILDSMLTSHHIKDSVAVNHMVAKTAYDTGIPDSRTLSTSTLVNYPMDQDLLHISPSSSFLNFLETSTRNSVYMTPYNCTPADLSPEPLASGTVPETGVTDLLQRRVIRPSTPMNLPNYSLQKVLETTPLKRQAIITKGLMPETSKSKNSREHFVVISELFTDQDILFPSTPQQSCPSKVRNDEGATAIAEKSFNSIAASSLKPTSSEEPPAHFSQNPLINESCNQEQQTIPKIRTKRGMPISPAFASALI